MSSCCGQVSQAPVPGMVGTTATAGLCLSWGVRRHATRQLVDELGYKTVARAETAIAGLEGEPGDYYVTAVYVECSAVIA